MSKISSEKLKQWRGVQALVHAAIDQGTTAIERVHLQTARRTFDVLDQIPPVKEPSAQVHSVHDSIVSTVYGTIRSVNQLVGKSVEAALDKLEGTQPTAATTVTSTSELPPTVPPTA